MLQTRPAKTILILLLHEFLQLRTYHKSETLALRNVGRFAFKRLTTARTVLGFMHTHVKK
ncbi:MAG TPA: hypothetical protein VK666_28605 [Chryseolinea sp.]|nr:hypothetical protein [Chryseolinea sp.]